MAWYTVSFFSEILHHETEMYVAVPETTGSACRTVYLLHGGGGGGGIDHRRFFPLKGQIESWAETYNTVFAMPGAPDSFFCNTCEGVRYRDFVTEELMGRIHGLLPVSKDRRMTAVAGMSMGGTSAFYIGLAAPEKIGNIACFCSGNLCVNSLSNKVHRYALKHVFGVNRIEDIRNGPYDIFENARALVRAGRPLPYIFHACGAEDHGLEHAHLTAEWFQKNEPEFEYTYYEPETGGHTTAFFVEWMERFLKNWVVKGQ